MSNEQWNRSHDPAFVTSSRDDLYEKLEWRRGLNPHTGEWG